MYKEVIKIEKVTYYKIVNEKLVILEKEDGNYRLYNYPDFTDEKIVEGNFGGDIINIGNLILGSNFKGFNIKDLSIQNPLVEQSYVMHNDKNIITKKVFYKERRVNYFLYNINFELVRQIATDYPVIMKSGLLITREGNVGVYNLKKNKQLWRQDFSKIAEYQEIDGENILGEIREVYGYKDSIIVLTQLFIFRIDIQTGKILCQQKLPAGFIVLSIHKNKAYSCYGYHFIEIDLETLEVLNFHRIEYEDYDGKQHFTIMNHPIFDAGLIYHAFRLEGGLHCIGAIRPETGKRIWMHPVGGYDINNIAFYDNKMFVLDSGGTLHIYEKEETAT
ncbi:hypothetical protein OOZ15_18785 [Galbibacter sp. EGI 63066]|uniref:hypothetical protein n=1 Tax=Galbibacter sp. EGI 63066 TaxID=2993559 RepID=UPI0022489155|nr:hypothetical protein [Galbibacter sp. EGI 63066]MCX2682005.1 hypothetical protein [Galbibacter sp. EGI 63066]